MPKDVSAHEAKLQIPEGKAQPMFVSPAVDAQKREIESKRHLREGVEYGLPYEHVKKAQKARPGMGIEPRNPTAERKAPVGEPEEFEYRGLRPRQDRLPDLIIRKPCYAYGDYDKCDGMMCDEDDECASSCCSRVSNDGYKQCQPQIEGGFCPRAVAPRIDYSEYWEQDHAYHRANAIDGLRKDGYRIPQQSNALPAYKG